MRHRCVGDRLDLLDLADAEVREPAVEAKLTSPRFFVVV
jgi:hypothetical protein